MFVEIFKDGITRLVPEQPLESLKGCLKGMDASGLREEEDRI